MENPFLSKQTDDAQSLPGFSALSATPKWLYNVVTSTFFVEVAIPSGQCPKL